MKAKAAFFWSVAAAAVVVGALPWFLAPRIGRRLLESKRAAVASAFRGYLAARSDEWAFVASDNVLRSSSLQFAWGQDLPEVQAHLVALVAQFDALKAVAMYDRSGRLLAATDYGVAVPMLPPTLLTALEMPVFGWVEVPRYGRHLLSVTGPLRNPVGFRIGFVRAFFSLDPLMQSCGLARDQRLFVFSEGRPVALGGGGDGEDLLRPVSTAGGGVARYGGGYLGVEGEESGLRWVLLQRGFPAVLRGVVAADAVLALTLVMLAMAAGARRRQAEESERLRRGAEEVLQGSQETLRRVEEMKAVVEEVRAMKPEVMPVMGSVKGPDRPTEEREDDGFKLVGP